MADLSDHIPANATRFDEGFKRLCDADPRAAEVRTEFDRFELDRLEGKVCAPQMADAYNKLEDIERDVADFFLEELSCGSLAAYRRDPHTGQDLRVPAEEWNYAEIVAGDYKTFPPVYFLKVEFDAWFRKVQGKNRKKGSPVLELAGRALRTKFGDHVPRLPIKELTRSVHGWCKEQEIPENEWPSPTHILRAAGRRK
jgi:hypothetical protein